MYNYTDYCSLMHSTCNEAGDHEVEIVYKRGFWRWLFRRANRIETYVGYGGTVWYRKGTGERAGTCKEMEICNVVEMLRQARGK